MNETSTQTINQNTNSIANVVDDESVSVVSDDNSEKLTFQLGLWLSGLESFLKSHSKTSAEEDYLNHNWIKEFRLTHRILLLCSKLALEFSQIAQNENSGNLMEDEIEILENLQGNLDSSDFSLEELTELAVTLKDCILLNEGFLRADKLNFTDWVAWSKTLGEKFENVSVFQKLIEASEKESENFLPEKLQKLLNSEKVDASIKTELKILLPNFAKILKWLSVIGKMLEDDRPLKTSLILFSRISKQMQEMIDYVNNLLSRYPDEEDALFDSLDSAAYTASIELRKVYNQELKELVGIRSSPLVYAKVENAYCLLNDSLQLTLANFGQLLDSEMDSSDIFPNLKVKEEQSVILRENMWNVLQSVQEAEKSPEDYPLDSLHKELTDFSNEHLGLLFYKDIETVERFIEEVLLMKDTKDLVPILHRFGAYLETLLGQINMRAVLSNHPFEPLQGHQNPHDMFV